MDTYEGDFSGDGLKIGVVVSRFNDFIGKRLLSGALDCLRRHNVATTDIRVAWVPGAFEIPLIAKEMISQGGYDAIICLGAVIRGETPHFDYICGEAAKGISSVSLESGVPLIFGVITADTIEQAVARAGGKSTNKGFSTAENAIEMANLIKNLKRRGVGPSHN